MDGGQKPGNEFDARLAQLSPERRALVERMMRARAAGEHAGQNVVASSAPPSPDQIPRRADRGPAPLTPGQELLWALDQAVPDVVAYNVPRVINIRGAVDIPALQRALDSLVSRHEALRTRFTVTNDGVRQVVHDAVSVPLERLDWRGDRSVDPVAALNALIVDRTRYHFDLSRDLLLRATLVQTGDAAYTLVLLTHHIVCDEWSRDVTFRELTVLYNAYSAGTEPALAPLPVQYADYAVWQRDAMERGVLAGQLAYWRQQLNGLPTLELPTDRPRSSVPTFAGARRRYRMSPDLLNALRALSRAHDTTLNMTMLAIYSLVLARHSGQDDVVVGSPISARGRTELEGLIGYFPNVLVLRTQIQDDPSFGELLRRTRKTCLDAYEHQDVPLEKLALELRNAGQLGHAPLFQVWFVMQSPEVVSLSLGDAIVEPQVSDFATAKFDLLMGASEDAEGLHVVLEYRTDILDAETVDRFFDHMRVLAEAACAEPTRRVSALPLLSPHERALVVTEWNNTAVAFPKGETLVSLMRAQATKSPEAVAVIDDRRALSFAELDQAASALAVRLRAAGATRGTLVGVCAERSVEMVVALVAVLKSGAAYVPLDPESPADRLRFMIEDANVPVLVAQQRLVDTLPALASCPATIIALDGCAETFDASAEITWPDATPDDVAYMIYTSGSTGRPKGALNAHSGIVNRLLWMQREYQLSASDVVLQKTPFSFDVSVWEFFWPLLSGATLVMARPGGHRDAGYLVDVMTSRRVTVCHFVPSMLRAFLSDPTSAQCTTLRDVMASGEALSPDLVGAFYETLPHARLHNLYGPTECAVDVSYWPCPVTTTPPAVVPIGRPVANTQLYVLDAHLQPCPIGVPGELYLAGVQVGLGYHNRAELTTERYVPDAFSSDSNARMYRTGDRARWRADGTVEYLGRLDFQVKVRGFRIELGEIETTLTQHPLVHDAATMAHSDESGGVRLVAYVVADDRESGGDVEEAVDRWAEVFDRTYANADETGDAVESGFNIAGWISSYDKRPIPAHEMREWVDNTCLRILAGQPKRVLEIGCGTGLLLFRIAPHVERFHGLDISATAIEGIQADPSFAAIADKVTLAQARADEIGSLEPALFDVIVINSVVQYFPSAEYLLQVLESAVKLVAPGGRIFVGDVRLLPLLETLHTSVALFEASDDLSITDLRARAQQRLWHESELVVDPGFFEALRMHVPAISAIEVLIKRGEASNELTKFRGDVVLHVGATNTTGLIPSNAATATTLAQVEQLLAAEPAVLRLTDLVDARLVPDLAAAAMIATAPAQRTVSELRESLRASSSDAGMQPESLAHLDARYDVSILWPESNTVGRFDAILRHRTKATTAAGFPAPPRGVLKPWSEFVHHPAEDSFSPEQTAALRAHLGATLPDYMIPSAFVRLREMPLTPSGKIDRKSLRPPAGVHRATASYVAPRTPTETLVSALWADVLGVERVGIEDGFLDLGGHSLLAMRIVGRVRREMNIRIGLDSLVRGESVAQFAAAIDALRAAPVVEAEEEFALAPVSRSEFRRSWKAKPGDAS